LGGYDVIKRFKSRKGFSLVEMILSIALLAMVTIPVTAGFASISAINMKTKKQIEINSVARIVQQVVIESVKNGKGLTNTSGTTVYLKQGGSYYNQSNIKVVSSSNIENKKYIFDARYTTLSSGLSAGMTQYDITLKSRNNNNKVKVFQIIIDG
jgi:prepilin-type N-terminal cleavage/methylation domain-containing protein